MATSPNRVRYLTFSDIETVAFEIASHFSTVRGEQMPRLQLLGGQAGAEVLAGILELPRQTIGGEDAYPTIFDKAAVLLRSVALDHPFVDGNKRMALGTTVTFLALNGWFVAASSEELVDFVLDVVMGKSRDLAQIADWLSSRAQPLE